MVDIRMPDGRIVPFPDDVTEQQLREFIMRSAPPAAGAAGTAGNAVPAEAGTFAGLADRLQAFGTALESAMPSAAPHGGSFPGNRRENGNALANILTSPTVTDMLMKRRLNFLG
jgi:hypothetical protein